MPVVQEALEGRKKKKANPLIQEAKYYLKEIRANNPTSQKRLNLRTGLIQVVAGNTPGLKINSGDNTMPFLGGEWIHKFESPYGLEVRGLYAQNGLYPPNDSDVGRANDSAFFYTADISGRYILEFDPTRKGNYFAARLGYHLTQNNFEVVDDVNQFIIQNYSGVLGGIERGLTVTERIHLTASLDMVLMLNTKDKTQRALKSDGYALFVRGEFYYLTKNKKNQFGLSYWQAAYTGELDATSKTIFGKQNHVTTYRVLGLSYSWLF